MLHHEIELAIWLLLAWFIGCLFGWFAKNIFGAKPAPVATLAAATTAAVAAPKIMTPAPAPAAPVVRAPEPVVQKPIPAPTPVVAPVVAASEPTVVAATTPHKMERPKGIAAARGGKADNLQRISGIGPKNEKILHTLGFFHFDQIANWTASEQHWVDDHLKFHGRIVREEWVRQARLLADCKDAEFNKEFGTGGLKGKDGKTHSGSHTRRR